MFLPGQRRVCASTHSLASIIGLQSMQPTDGTPASDINVPHTHKRSAAADFYFGLCTIERYLPRSGHTGQTVCMNPEVVDCHGATPEDLDDLDYLRERRPTEDIEYHQKLEQIANVEKICWEARKVFPDGSKATQVT